VQYSILSFILDADQEVSLSLMDNQGRLIKTERFGRLHAGQNQVVLQRDNLPAGMYYFRLDYASGEGKSGSLLIQD
jgi:hypothetical protein